jgi:predicted lipid-binding transport protein (Tim44 family)
MDGGFPFFDIIIFAAIAAFLVLRLRNVLGRRTGHQSRPDREPFQPGRVEDQVSDKVVHLPDRTSEERRAGEESPLGAGITQIKVADPSFEQGSFLVGAKTAFEMILNAFARSDAETLRPLLSNEVYEDFAGAIKARREADHTLETTLVGITTADIIEAEMQGRTAFVTVKFVSEQVNVTRDSDGKVIEGDPGHVTEVTDIWTFARNTRSRDPNWTLVATSSPN